MIHAPASAARFTAPAWAIDSLTLSPLEYCRTLVHPLGLRAGATTNCFPQKNRHLMAVFCLRMLVSALGQTLVGSFHYTRLCVALIRLRQRVVQLFDNTLSETE